MTLLKSQKEAKVGARVRPMNHVRPGRVARKMPMTTSHRIEEQILWPVVILYNVDSSWTDTDVMESEQYLVTMANALTDHGHPVELAQVRCDVVGPLQRLDPREYIVFNWCEGLDGVPRSYDRIPPVLEELGFAYTGANAWTLAVTQDKAATKTILDEQDIPTPAWRAFSSSDEVRDWNVFPAIVKPAAEHCSSGITDGAVVSNRKQLRERIKYILESYGGQALVEDFIVGREFNVSIWGNGRPMPLPLYEIDFSDIPDTYHRLVDFDAKWSKGSFSYEHTPSCCPADVDDELAERIRSVAMAAYRALHLRDYGRIDMRVRDRQPYVVDVNSNPDITIDGGFAKTTAVAGYSYGAAISYIINLAAHRKSA
jgi:D-alanine-D-alanine ligase